MHSQKHIGHTKHFWSMGSGPSDIDVHWVFCKKSSSIVNVSMAKT